MSTCPIRGSVPSRFAALTKPRQRVAIARDVIKQLKAKRLKAHSGVFVSFKGTEPLNKTLMDEPTLTVKQLLKRQKVKTCDVCALGGLMMAQFSVNGDCRVADLGSESNVGFSWDNVTTNRLTPYTNAAWHDCESNGSTFSPFILAYFDAAQLELIEIAFECGDGAFGCADAVQYWKDSGNDEPFRRYVKTNKSSLTVEQCAAAIRFGRRYRSERNRLVAIMNAIIDGKGAFSP